MFDCVLHAMYINFSTIHCKFTVLTFIALSDLLSVTYNSNFIDIFTAEQSLISSSNKTSVTYKT